jgi:hypothetical protein
MHTLIDPAILFFVFGVFAGLIKSNLEIPAPISRFLSLYLLMALGLKGASRWRSRAHGAGGHGPGAGSGAGRGGAGGQLPAAEPFHSAL